VPACPALLRGAALEVLAYARPAGAILGVQVAQLGILLRAPGVLQAWGVNGQHKVGLGQLVEDALWKNQA